MFFEALVDPRVSPSLWSCRPPGCLEEVRSLLYPGPEPGVGVGLCSVVYGCSLVVVVILKVGWAGAVCYFYNFL